MDSAPEFAGLVLAGGASSRMGRDKALLSWHGRTLLEHAVRQLAEAGADPVLVSGDRPDHDCIPDEQPGLGPLGGLLSVLGNRPGLMDRVLVVTAVDTPGLSPGALQELVAAMDEECGGSCFRDHPLPLAFRPTPLLREQLQTLLADGGKASMRRFGELANVRELDGRNHDLSNVNTPADWDGFIKTSA